MTFGRAGGPSSTLSVNSRTLTLTFYPEKAMNEFDYLHYQTHLNEAENCKDEAHCAAMNGNSGDAAQYMALSAKHSSAAEEFAERLKAPQGNCPAPDSRWIPWPSENRPEDAQRVLVTWPEADFAPWEAFYMGDPELGTVGFYRPDRGCYDEHMRMGGVTAWMPWPEIYTP